MPVFEKKEYLQRISTVKKHMSANGCDVLWITCPPNINYLTGYDAWSFYVHQGLIVSLEEELPFWIGRHIDATAAQMTSCLPDDHILPYGEEYVTTGKHPLSFVADALKRLNLATARIGVEMDTHYFTAKALAVLESELPNATFKDCDLVVNWVRTIKSDKEVQYLKEAGEITDIAMQAAIDAIEPGVRQCDVAGLIFHKLISGHPDFYGDMPDYQTLPMGERTSAPHLTWTDAPFEKGTLCTLELGANRFRYHAPLARTVAVGEPQASVVEKSKYVGEGLAAALDAVKPGVLACDIEAAWRNATRPYGIIKESRIGYSVGLGYPPDWGERTISLAPGDTTPLQENMVLHLMLGVWEETIGYEISETFQVTASGACCMSKLPRTLMVKHG